MPSKNIVHIAIELSVSSWLVAARLPGADKSRLHRITGGDTTALLALIAELRARASAKLGQAVEVAYCFEAGRDGFWLHRLLTAHGIAAYVLEPTKQGARDLTRDGLFSWDEGCGGQACREDRN